MMFLLKKIAGLLLSPLTVCISFLVLGLLLLLIKKKEKIGKFIIMAGVISMIFMSFNVLPDKILGNLERKYKPLLNMNSISEIRWVVVLGGGCSADSTLPVISRLSHHSLFRLVEGISIHNKIPKSKIIFSGGSAFDSVPESKVMANAALELGVDSNKIILESESLDTESQALFIKKIIGDDKFILVTSAFHMQRSMAIFQKAGMNPIPAPVGHLVKKAERINPFMYFPDSTEIKKLDLAVHEYLGLLWLKIRGDI
ncbi:MAG: YdcF family protein [Proteobacteria bacterium]|nr:YdcF family protein [Pseudomonadota bacterium]